MSDIVNEPKLDEYGYLSTVRDDNVFVKDQFIGGKIRVIYHYSSTCRFCREFKSMWNRIVLSNPSVEFRASVYRGVAYPEDFYKSPTVPFIFKVKTTDSNARYVILGSDQRGLIQSFIESQF